MKQISSTGKFLRHVGLEVPSAKLADEHGDALAMSEHPAFKQVAFWMSQGVIGVNTVAHHA